MKISNFKLQILNFKLIVVSCILMTIGGFSVYSQDDDLKSELDVIKAYKPILADAIKIRFQPELPELDDAPPTVTYDIPVKTVPIEFVPETVKAIAMPRDRKTPLKPAYLKLGYGNLNTALIEFYVSSPRSKKYRYGVKMNHLSAKGKLINQSFSNNLVSGFGEYYLEKHTVELDMGYGRDVWHYYADRTDVGPVTSDSVRQRFTVFNVHASAYNHKPNKAKIDYKFDVDLFNLNDVHGFIETGYTLKGTASKETDNGDVASVMIAMDPVIVSGTASTARYFYTLAPSYNILQEKWQAHIGGKGVLENKKAYLLPDLEMTYDVMADRIQVFAGWKGHMVQNGYYDLVKKNPFISNDANFESSRHLATYGGLRGNVNKQLSYNVKYAYRWAFNTPYFINDSTDNTRAMVLDYDSLTQFHHLYVSLNYNRSEKLSLLVKGEFFDYTLSHIQKAWHTPTQRLAIEANYNIQDKIYLKGEAFVQDEVYALVDGAPLKLKGYADINIGIRYRYLKNLAFFLDMNNLLGQKYLLYHQYPSFGFNIVGGLSFAF